MNLMTIKTPWGDEMPVSAYNPIDPQSQHVIAFIYRIYGFKAIFKGKCLFKFGRTTNADTDTKTTVATFGTVGTPNVNETYSTTNDIDKLSSSSASDTETIVVEGHTIDSLGRLSFVEQEVTLTGQTPVELTTPIARCNRMYVKKGTFASPANNLVGNIYAFASSGVTVTAGVPQTNTAVKCTIVAGKNQTEKAAISIEDNNFWCIKEFNVSTTRSGPQTVTVDHDIQYREIGGVFRPAGLELDLKSTVTNNTGKEFETGILIPPNSDVRLCVTSDTNDTQSSGFMAGHLMTTEWEYDSKSGNITFT